MSRSDDTAFPCWDAVRVRPRFPGRRSRPRCRSVPVHLPEATSGYPLGCSPKRSKEERSAREGGFPCRSVGRCAPAASLGKGRGTRTVTSASSAQHEEICGAPPLLSEGEERGGAPRQPRWRLCGVCSAWIRSSYSGAVGKKTVFWLSRKSTTPRKVIVLPGGWSVATLPTSALNPAVGVTCSEAS